LLTSNLSAERKKMPLAGVNIARAVTLVSEDCCFRYATNAIEAPLASRHRAVRRFQETKSKRATIYRDDRFLNNNGVPLFLPVSVLLV
jgi:ribosome-binding protein aMBF1 (putative translation factor)